LLEKKNRRRHQKQSWGWALVAHACNPSYSGGRDQEDHDSKSALANSLKSYLKKPITKKGWWNDSRYRS
jgi:hypothetical protein